MDFAGLKSVAELENILYRDAANGAVCIVWQPEGMHIIVKTDVGEIIVINKIAFFKSETAVFHPMLYELWKAQGIEADDDKASVVIITQALLKETEKLIKMNFDPSEIANEFSRCTTVAIRVLANMPEALQIYERDILANGATLVLNSTVMRQYASLLAPLAVDAVLSITVFEDPVSIDLTDIKVIHQLGGIVEETELVKGLVFCNENYGINGPKRIENARIALIQFCISPLEVDLDYNAVDTAAIDRMLKEEHLYIIRIVKQIKQSGCNILLIPKNMLREAVSNVVLHYLDQCDILVVKDIEDEDVEFACKMLNCRPIASLDHFLAHNLVKAQLVEEVHTGTSKFVKITGIENPGRAVTVLVKGSSDIVLHQAARSLEFAMTVVRCMVDRPSFVPGAGALEIELGLELKKVARELNSIYAYYLCAYARAVERIPLLLAEKAGLDPNAAITELRIRHARGEKAAGIDVTTGAITINAGQNNMQSIGVTCNMLELAGEYFHNLISMNNNEN